MGRNKRRVMDEEDEYLVGPATNARVWHPGGDLYAEDPEHRNHCSRLVVVVISVLLMLGGVAIAVLGRIEKEKKIFPLCPHCNDLIVVLYIIGACVGVVGLVGLIAAATRVRCLAVVFTVLLIVFTLVLAAAGTAAAIYDSGMHKDDLRRLWQDAVRDDPQVICDLQGSLDCSGFSKCCNLAPPLEAPILPSAAFAQLLLQARDAPNTTTAAPTPSSSAFPSNNICDIDLDEYTAQCSPQCTNTNSANQDSCSAKAEDELKRHIAAVLGALFGLAVVLAATSVASIRMVLKS